MRLKRIFIGDTSSEEESVIIFLIHYIRKKIQIQTMLKLLKRKSHKITESKNLILFTNIKFDSIFMI